MAEVSQAAWREAAEQLRAVEGELRKGIVGQRELVRGVLIGILANGHVLIEGVPGLGKTRVVNLLARICGVSFKRLQFTPDLLPADIIGTRVFHQQAGTFETVRGPIFANFILADEINRAPAKVQSALLETMQERQVTIGRESIAVEPPFLVFATQNPIEQEGTYPLPEAQLDRFLIKLVVSYPADGEEQEIVRMVLDETELPPVERILGREEILRLQSICRRVFIEERLVRYATELTRASRRPKALELELGHYIDYGASPRASLALAQASRALALFEGRDSVIPDDLKAVAHAVLRHRIIPSYYAEAEEVTTDQIVDEIVATIPVP